MAETQPVRPIGPADLPAVLALNNRHASELSELDAAALAALVANAFAAEIVGDCEALLIALDQDAAYASPNFLWFRARYTSFVYVDRIVVDPVARGRGHARRLYEGLLAKAAARSVPRVVCEVNVDPPNPASDAFHAAFSFVPVGEALLPGGCKRVRYFERLLP